MLPFMRANYLLIPLLILAVKLQAQTEAETQPDTCAASLAAATKPTICIKTPHPTLTVNRDSGQAHIYISIGNSHLEQECVLEVFVSVPANPSGIDIHQGRDYETHSFTISPGTNVKDSPIRYVQLAYGNHQSGQITYVITARPKEEKASSQISVLGTPITVNIQTSP